MLKSFHPFLSLSFSPYLSLVLLASLTLSHFNAQTSIQPYTPCLTVHSLFLSLDVTPSYKLALTLSETLTISLSLWVAPSLSLSLSFSYSV